MSKRLRKGSTCPTCKKAKLVPIAYGLPGPEMRQEFEMGMISLGGCCVTDSDPELECLSCKEKFMRDGEWVLISER
ncbi:MAG: hypothetical protein WCP88_04950 [bacterium]